MDNASLLYEEIKSYADIQKLIGTHEDIFIDFKEAQDPNTGKRRSVATEQKVGLSVMKNILIKQFFLSVLFLFCLFLCVSTTKTVLPLSESQHFAIFPT